ncbi:MAG: hypothetical protein NUV98_02010 [Candidatus Roizmanbacteria bacterium]|nr:hypothetical protein [Candidatus Roizmanbacteria bacterium]
MKPRMSTLKTPYLVGTWSVIAGALWWFVLFGKNDADQFVGILHSQHLLITLLAYPLLTFALFFSGMYCVKRFSKR